MDSTLPGNDNWISEKMLIYIFNINQGVFIVPCLVHNLVLPGILIFVMLVGG